MALHPSTEKSIRRFAVSAPTTRLLDEIDHHRKMAATYPADAGRCNAIAEVYQEIYNLREYAFIAGAVPGWNDDICKACGFHHGPVEESEGCPSYYCNEDDEH